MKAEPQRTCIGCRRRDDQSALIRLVRAGNAVIDATAPRLPGRGAYVHEGCLPLLAPRKAIPRTFGPAAVLDPALASGRLARHSRGDEPARVEPASPTG